jgi:hypothetical protein
LEHITEKSTPQLTRCLEEAEKETDSSLYDTT